MSGLRAVLPLLLLLLPCMARAASPTPALASVYFSPSPFLVNNAASAPPSGSYTVKAEVFDAENAVAFASFADTANNTGWMTLRLSTNANAVALADTPGAVDAVQMYAAGYLEAFLTAARIEQAVLNYLEHNSFISHSDTRSTSPTFDKIGQWLMDQMAWTDSQNASDPFWQLAQSWNAQLRGLFDGYTVFKTEAMQPLSLEQITAWNANGDVDDIAELFAPARRLSHRLQSCKSNEESRFERRRIVRDYRMRNEHCSAMVGVSQDRSALFAGHTTWTTYTQMLRIYKIMKYDFVNPLAKIQTVSYSSMPGVLSSVDDYYQVVGEGGIAMVIVETTNSVFEDSLYDLMTNRALLSWQRCMLANVMANSPQRWTEVFSEYNSGTYSNSWLVVAMHLFAPFKPLVDGLLWIVEQTPGYCAAADVTDMLRFAGYYPSFNVPFLRSVQDRMGYTRMFNETGDVEYSWELDYRSQIFRKRATESLASASAFGQLLQFNDFQNDPVGRGDPWAAISCRFDLDAQSPWAFGGIDAKVTTSDWIRENRAMIKNGPTVEGQPVFSFVEFQQRTGQVIPHHGMPDRYDFGWVVVGEA